MWWNLLVALRTLRKAKVIVKVDPSRLEEIVRNASAYGWEIGAGAPMTVLVDATATNPFLNPGWRGEVT